MSFNCILKSSAAISVLSILFLNPTHAGRIWIQDPDTGQMVTNYKYIIQSEIPQNQGVKGSKGEGIKIGVIDTPFNPSNKAVKDNTTQTVTNNFHKVSFIKQMDAIKEAAQSNHSNHVASTITEIIEKVTIRPVEVQKKVLSADPIISSIGQGIDILLRKNVDIINISMGRRKEDLDIAMRAEEKDALRKARDRKIGLVFSAGNDSLNMQNYLYHKERLKFAQDEMGGYMQFAVATEYKRGIIYDEKNEKIAKFSNIPSEEFSDQAFAAPGTDILAHGAQYKLVMQGTSMAAPILTAAAAEVLGILRANYNLNATAKDAFEILKVTARKKNLNGTNLPRGVFGKGVPQVEAASEYLQRKFEKEKARQIIIIRELLAGTRNKVARTEVASWMPQAIGARWPLILDKSSSSAEGRERFKPIIKDIVGKSVLYIATILKKNLEELESIFAGNPGKLKENKGISEGLVLGPMAKWSNYFGESAPLEPISKELFKYFLKKSKTFRKIKKNGHPCIFGKHTKTNRRC